MVILSLTVLVKCTINVENRVNIVVTVMHQRLTQQVSLIKISKKVFTKVGLHHLFRCEKKALVDRLLLYRANKINGELK